MPRYKLVLEYYGKPFVGWQRQENGPSVQAALEAACAALSGEAVAAQAAGRTDAGVHALGMVVHIDLAKGLAADVVLNALNHLLKPAPIAVVAAEIVDDEFHARFSCTRRSYEYRIINRRAPLTIEAGRAWHVATPLDAEAMDAAAQILLGHHDFTTFRTTVCQANSPEKTLDELSVSRAGSDIFIRCAARSFLHHQVRSMTGSLVEVGRGRWRASDLKAALEARDRARCGVVAPPDGLYFLHADYTNKK